MVKKPSILCSPVLPTNDEVSTPSAFRANSAYDALTAKEAVATVIEDV